MKYVIVILSEAKNLIQIAIIQERFFASLRMTEVSLFLVLQALYNISYLAIEPFSGFIGK